MGIIICTRGPVGDMFYIGLVLKNKTLWRRWPNQSSSTSRLHILHPASRFKRRGLITVETRVQRRWFYSSGTYLLVVVDTWVPSGRALTCELVPSAGRARDSPGAGEKMSD